MKGIADGTLALTAISPATTSTAALAPATKATAESPFDRAVRKAAEAAAVRLGVPVSEYHLSESDYRVLRVAYRWRISVAHAAEMVHAIDDAQTAHQTARTARSR